MESITREINNINLGGNESMEEEEEVLYKYVMSVDVGILNLGLTISRIDQHYNFIEVVWLDLIDITQFKHVKDDCKLNHTKTFCDWLEHVYEDNKEFFDKVDHILIEKQPPCGLVAIEQLLFYRFREKASLINPINVHTFLNLGKDYDIRKIRSQKIGLSMVKDIDLVLQLKCYNRLHDIADSLCMVVYWLYKKREELTKQKKLNYIKNLNIEGVNIFEWIASFQFKPQECQIME